MQTGPTFSGQTLFASVLMMLPLLSPAHAADLVAWWEKGFYAEEDAAIREMAEAYQRMSGHTVQLSLYETDELGERVRTAVTAGGLPDFAYSSSSIFYSSLAQWAYDDRLASLDDTIDSLKDLFAPDVLASVRLVDGRTGHQAVYALPMTRNSNYLHVWNSLLGSAGIGIEEIPRDWNAFWAFWCDRVQPSVRSATGREDIWGVGMPMSTEATDTENNFFQAVYAHTTEWASPTGPNLLRDPSARKILLEALTEYTSLYKGGCTPPDSLTWTQRGNNDAFIAQRVVMTANAALSIPAALRTTRPEDYYHNALTIDWPPAIDGQPLHILGGVDSGVVFASGRHVETAKDFVHFLVAEGWLAHWLSFAGDRFFPPLRGLISTPFWLDPSDPHRLRAAVQLLNAPQVYGQWGLTSDEARRLGAPDPPIWGLAVHRVVADGLTPEQAVDEAIARIHAILGE